MTGPERPRSASGRFTAKAKPSADAGPEPRSESAPGGAIALFFLRHADAGDSLTWAGNDADRPLSGKGRKQAKRLGRLLREVGAGVDACFSSPRRRAADTAKLVGKANGRSYVVDDRLDAGFGEEALAALLRDVGVDVTSVMLVGHDPDFSAIVSWLVGAPLEMRKSALAVIDLPDRRPAAGRGSLRWLLPPDAVAG